MFFEVKKIIFRGIQKIIITTIRKPTSLKIMHNVVDGMSHNNSFDVKVSHPNPVRMLLRYRDVITEYTQDQHNQCSSRQHI